jgi:hypothetical protein
MASAAGEFPTAAIVQRSNAEYNVGYLLQSRHAAESAFSKASPAVSIRMADVPVRVQPTFWEIAGGAERPMWQLV